MKRVVLSLILVLTLTGCSNAVAGTISTPTTASETTLSAPPVATKPPETKKPFSLNTDSMPGFDTSASPAIAPAQVNIANLYPGATAEWQILVHNGDGLTSKILLIETDERETVADIPFPVTLEDGLSNIVSIQSNLKVENKTGFGEILYEQLKATAYNVENKTLTIQGFTPAAKRIAKITYTASSAYASYYRVPDVLTAGYDKPSIEAKGWVTFDKTQLLLHPMETGRVTVTLKIPQDAKVSSNKWEFWIGVMEAGGTELNTQVSTEIELCSRVLVTMR